MFGCWFDDKLTDAIDGIERAYSELREYESKNISKVAYITDGPSVKYARVSSTFHTENVHLMREAVGRMGTAVDCLESGDLLSENFPDGKYKLMIFGNLIAPDTALFEKLESLRKKGVSFLFLGPAGAVKDGRLDFGNMKSLIRMNVGEDTGVCQYIAYAKEGFGAPEGESGILEKSNTALASPSLVLCDGDAEPFAFDLLKREKIRGGISERDGGFDAWVASGPVPPSILTRLSERAGVHVINRDGIPIYVNSRMLAAFSEKGGEHTFDLGCASTVKELFTGREYETKCGRLTVEFSAGECLCFLIK